MNQQLLQKNAFKIKISLINYINCVSLGFIIFSLFIINNVK